MRILHVGLAHPTRTLVERFLAGRQTDLLLDDPPPNSARHSAAESVLDALFVTGNAQVGEAFTTILVQAAPEMDHLEEAIRSLRQVNPDARIVLLCEPPDEAGCRAALQWGADDYHILPLDERELPRIIDSLRTQGGHRARREIPAAPRSPGSPNPPATELLSLPLLAQTDLLEELLDGAGARADLSGRAAGILQRYLPIRGALRFIPEPKEEGAGPPPAGTLHHPVAAAGQKPFGTLEFTPDAPAAPSGQNASLHPALLAQAAHWLAAMLALGQRYQQLRTLAITDELSGAYNRRYFDKFMTGLLQRSREGRARVTLLLFDIDDFKKYNDSFGHAAGDAIIRELIKLLRACTREYDLVARIGGDEFAVVYRDNEAPRQPNSQHPRDVLVATERFREAIRNHQWPQICKIKGEISISGGLANFPADADTLEALMARADQALLKAKAAGKNVILLHAKDPAPAGPAAR